MITSYLVPALVFLAAMALAAPLGKLAKVSSVLGYLIAGILIGPYGLGLVYEVYQVQTTLHLAEFGIILLLFTIGLELRPQRLWTMRNKVFGVGGAQVVLTAIALELVLWLIDFPVHYVFLIGPMLALSSTAFVLQLMEENRELSTQHGRLGFSILLFQDLAAIPMLALVPLFAAKAAVSAGSVATAAMNLAVVAAAIIAGRYVTKFILRIVAETGVREAMTATALSIVAGVAFLMHWAGLSAALGAFIAGVLFAGSSFRHQLEADVAPFKGLFLGLFFIAIGMSLDIGLVKQKPVEILAGVLGLVLVKSAVMFIIGKATGLETAKARRLALTLSQSGEFAFVILTTAVASQVMDRQMSSLIAVIVTLSMALTPLLLLIDNWLAGVGSGEEPEYETPPEGDGHVVIAGFGRFGQIVARILRARNIPFTALDRSSSQVDFVAQFGNKIYYGDAGRLEILDAAQTSKARAFVLAIDDVESSLAVARCVRQNFPDVPIFARARNRSHVYHLMDLGVTIIERETYLSALDISRKLLLDLGYSMRDSDWSVETFRKHDERRLYDDYQHFTDMEKMYARAQAEADELELLFRQDAEEQAKLGEKAD